MGLDTEKYELLSSFYLSLWKQLDRLGESNRWLDISFSDSKQLSERVQDVRRVLQKKLTDEEIKTVLEKDLKSVEELTEQYHKTKPEKAKDLLPKIEELKLYLREQGLRYASEHSARI